MFSRYADTLFALYMNDGQASIGWLVDFRCGSTAADREEVQLEVQRDIGMLKSAGLLTLFMTDGVAYMALTDSGDRFALIAADILSTRMVEQWQQLDYA